MLRPSTFRDFDWTLFGFVMLMSIISVAEIYSATLHTKFHGFHTRQMTFLAVAIPAMFIISLIDYHRLLEIAHWAYGISIASLLAVLVVGRKVLGARRWIVLPGNIHFQPSEWVKLVLIVASARYFWGLSAKDELDWKDIAKAFALIGVPMLLVLKQPDLGTTMTYAPVLVAGLFFGGISWKKAAIIIVTFLVMVVGVWKSGKILKPYQKARLTSFQHPEDDPKGTGYQVRPALIAVRSGGIWGKGATKGTQTQGDFLPIPYTDFIFAALCEEHGFVGAALVLILYFLILIRLVQNAQTAKDPPGTLLVMGVAAIMLFQIGINMGMVLGMMPVTGIPLPLLSYGGSSIIFTFLALGIVMNVRMTRFVN